MHAIEERTGRSHDDILSDLQSKEAKVRELSTEVQHLQSQIKNLESEKEKAQADLNAEKARLHADLEEHLKQHSLTLKRIEHISNIERGLSGYGIELTHLEGLQRVLNAVNEAGQDAKRLVELAKKAGSLEAQAEAKAKELAETRELVEKLDETVSKLEERLTEAELIMEKCSELESMGWNRECLEKTIKLAKEAGSPEEALCRLELLKPSAELKAEFERTKAETEALKEKALRTIKETLRRLSTLAEESSSLVSEKIPGIVAEVSNLTEKYGKLQDDFSRLNAEHRKLQRDLDDAISWSTLLREPEKLPGDRIGSIFFNVMLPRLETWCRGKESIERLDVVNELAKRIMCLYPEPAEPVANFMKEPEKASVADAILALWSFAAVAMPFYEALRTWYTWHKNEAAASKLFDAQYHLKQFYDEGIRKL